MIAQPPVSSANSAIMSTLARLHVSSIHAMILIARLAPPVQLIHAIAASPATMPRKPMSASHAQLPCPTAMSVKTQEDP